MRKTLTTAALLLALSCTASAGIIHTPPVAPEPTDSTQEQSADGSTVTTDSLIQTLLKVIVRVLP
jgi:nucleotidyltransferase/DNA polymerase involved in DNA repair